MRWFDELQFAAALAMPEETAVEYGTTVNGMWASPKTAAEVEEEHRKGRRVLFSVPLIALTPHVYEDESNTYLLDEVCCDVRGEPSEVDWYYWEKKPVYAACIYSDVFRRYLLDICRGAVAAGHDVVNLDEINTSIGLMDRDAGGCGFCPRCLDRFRAASRLDADNDELRRRLVEDDELYARYRAFHEDEAYVVAVAMIDEIRSWGGGCAVTANLAYLGNYVPAMGKLWGPMWGPALDFVMMENSYTLEHGSPHLLLPRGSFTPWYRLGSALTGAPTFVIPSILVPKQLAGQERSVYHQLMFLEAYANRGRFAYYWWPGADHETTLRATAPPELKHHIRFIRAHRAYYEHGTAQNDVAIWYLDSAISANPGAHFKYVALAQALAEQGYQFDVVYGDGADVSTYRTVVVPEGNVNGERFVTYADDVLTRLWSTYEDKDRAMSLAPLRNVPRIIVSAPRVVPTRYRCGRETIIHLLNYAYDESTDSVEPATALEVALPWNGEQADARLLTPARSSSLSARVEGETLVVSIDRIDLYGLLVLKEH